MCLSNKDLYGRIKLEITNQYSKEGGYNYDKFCIRISSNRFCLVCIEILDEEIPPRRQLWMWKSFIA